MLTRNATRRTVRAVAVFEAAKGILVLGAGFGLLTLLHRDVGAIATDWVERFHLNPSKHYPTIFIDAASRVTDARLWFLAWTALFYSGLRLVEAFGLWRERRWAEWIALISGGIYLPIEVYELTEKMTWVRLTALVTNLLVVAFMAVALRSRRRPAPPQEASKK
jgi:uncharacterized membrane protein (DUF2068 family)